MSKVERDGAERGGAEWGRGRVEAVGEGVRVRWARVVRRDAGMVTSEYAMGLIAAVGFAALLYEVLTSGQVREELQNIVGRALSERF